MLCGPQVPNDAEIIMATLKMKRRALTAIPPPPSTYAQDVAAITSHTGPPLHLLLLIASIGNSNLKPSIHSYPPPAFPPPLLFPDH